MNRAHLSAAPILGLTALMLAACGDGLTITADRSERGSGEKGVLRVIDTLQCPQTMGDLTRKGPIHQDGTVCTYVGPRGAEVSLHLIRLDGSTIDDSLNRFETQLSRDMPDAAVAAASHSATSVTTTTTTTPDEKAGDTASVRLPGLSVDAQGDAASVRLPGLTIDADGEDAQVRIGGVHINANGENADIQVNGGDEQVSIRADSQAAVVRARSTGGALRATWTLTSETPSAAGWRLVGYEARGPSGGPIVVATVRSKWRERGRVFDDAVDLVQLNVGD